MTSVAPDTSQPLGADGRTPILQVDDVRHSFYSGQTAKRVLRGVSLSVDRGEFVCIVGPSGCGKTTLLDMMAGFLLPEEGTISVEGDRVKGVQSASVGFMFAKDNLLPWRTAQGNVEFPIEFQSASRLERERRALELLEHVGLGGFGGHFPDELSHGMKQRVALARTLAMNRDVILMDEPFGALDAQTRIEMQELLASVRQAMGQTVVLVTHDLSEAICLADRILVMGQGEFVAEYTVPFDRPRSLEAISRNPQYGELLSEIWSHVRATRLKMQASK